MPVVTDSAGNYFIGSTITGVTRTELWSSNNVGLLADIRTLSGIRSGLRVSTGATNEACYSFTAPLGTGGEVNTSATSTDGVSQVNCDGAIGDNTRIAVMLWTDNTSRKPATINSGNTDSVEVTVDINSAVNLSSTYAIANNANARFWMTVSQARYITFFCYVDNNNWYSIEMGYTHAVSGVAFPLNCVVKYNIKYLGSEVWYAGVPTSVGLTGVTAIPQTGKVNYTHLLSTYATKDATNLYAVTATNGIGRCGTNLKITRVPSLYSTLGVRSTFQTDSDVLGSSKRNYMVIGSSGTNDSSLIFLCHCDGTGNVTGVNSKNEVNTSSMIEIGGVPTYSTSIFKFGNSSIACSSGQSVYQTTNLSSFAFGSGNFTAECFIYASSNANSFTILELYDINSTNKGWLFRWDSGGNLQYIANSQTIQVSWTPVANTWYHLAVCRNGSTTRFFVNGSQVGANQTSINTLTGGSYAFFYGTNISSGTLYHDEVAIWTSAKYTANFTAPTIPYAVLPELIAMQTN